jgi:hypothetical protein
MWYWLDALRNHVPEDASSANPGYRSSFSEPSARINVVTGNSSSTTTTTGPRSPGIDTDPKSPAALPLDSRSPVGLVHRNAPRKSALAMARYDVSSRPPRVRRTR